jgi:hypothetical protein
MELAEQEAIELLKEFEAIRLTINMSELDFAVMTLTMAVIRMNKLKLPLSLQRGLFDIASEKFQNVRKGRMN